MPPTYTDCAYSGLLSTQIDFRNILIFLLFKEDLKPLFKLLFPSSWAYDLSEELISKIKERADSSVTYLIKMIEDSPEVSNARFRSCLIHSTRTLTKNLSARMVFMDIYIWITILSVLFGSCMHPKIVNAIFKIPQK